ncbi:MAG: chemotaxis protein CheW [Nitrospinota bacterium]|nr:chemotaxis protein CheW [Nitrospinota bacterium]
MTEESVTNPEGRVMTHRHLAGKYLTFALGGEEFGINISIVKEIIKLMDITHIPQTPGYVKGVINLRERVIPVTDLRMKFGMPKEEYTHETCIIVLEMPGAPAGIIVDTVSEVVDIKPEEIEPPPSFDGNAEVANIQGMAKVKGRVIILLEILAALNSGGISKLTQED